MPGWGLHDKLGTGPLGIPSPRAWVAGTDAGSKWSQLVAAVGGQTMSEDPSPPSVPKPRKRHRRGATARPRLLRINRFTVMAMLQAARARHLGLPEESAFSWGLNRAIFYAAAKRGFRGATGMPKTGEPPTPTEERPSYLLGDELAYRDPTTPRLAFTIGGETQTEAQFRRQIASRFGEEPSFRKAWEEALAYVTDFPDEVLRSQREFYSAVYRPRRDALVAEWAGRYGPPPADA